MERVRRSPRAPLAIVVLLLTVPGAPAGAGGAVVGPSGDGPSGDGGPVVAPAGEIAGQEAPVRIDFEALPGGAPACERCPVSDEFRSLGVVFSFFSPLTDETRAYLVGSGAYDPEGEERNHSVTAALTAEGFRPGVLALSLPEGPRRVAFRLRGPDAVRAFAVRAEGPEGAALPPGAVSRAEARTYRAAGGGVFREERVSVEAAEGVLRVELDGTGPPGHILLVDDLVVWPRAGEERELTPDGR